jgi:serine/threonine protein kinase
LCRRIVSNIIRDIASSKKTSLCFIISILFWLTVEIYFSDIHLLFSHYKHSSYTSPRLGILEQAELLRARREQDALAALGPHGRYHRESSASWDSQDVSNNRVDRIPKGCSYISWHTLAFPNCNDIHEIDLTQALNIRRNGPMIPVFLGDDQAIAPDASIEEDWTIAQKMGYMGSGLWRQVWKVNPRYETNETLLYAQTSSNQSEYDPMYAPAVLKMMKQEQPFHERNFDRHRRDALVMERLTSSPVIPSIYGYCGNTVLTEFFGKSLSDVVFRGASTNTPLSPKSSQGRIRLALEVMRGIQALHEIEDGPIVHADIQIDQFLYDDRTDRIILNDFNRCRFLPRRNDTGKLCKVKIPSAPGGHRSPEEYDLMHIDEKVDLFSVGNVLYTILTGKIPWENRDRVDIQRNVRMGNIPDVDDEYRDEGSLDAYLLDIIENVFETDPAKRKSARVIVEELEALLERDVKVK